MNASAILSLLVSVIKSHGIHSKNRRGSLRRAGRNAGFFRCLGLHIRLETCYNNDEY